MIEYFPIETQGAFDQKSLFEILVKAASSVDSIENTAKILKNVKSANDIRYHLEKINDFESLKAQVNQALKSKIPSTIKKGCLKIAIDLNLIPYYPIRHHKQNYRMYIEARQSLGLVHLSPR